MQEETEYLEFVKAMDETVDTLYKARFDGLSAEKCVEMLRNIDDLWQYQKCNILEFVKDAKIEKSDVEEAIEEIESAAENLKKVMAVATEWKRNLG